MEGLFCYGEFFVDGEGSRKENDPTWAYPIEIEESCDAVEERGLEEVPVLLENTSLNQEEQKEGTWGESCLLLFSKFFGFLVSGYEEDKIFYLMNNICERRIIVKGKGVRGNEDQNFILECEGGNDETKRKLIKIFLKTQKADVVCI